MWCIVRALLFQLPMNVTTAPLPTGLDLAECKARAAGPAPALKRRMASFIYEGVLVFGIVMVAGGAFSVATNQRHGLQGRQGMMAVQFLVLAIYFLWTWLRGGQTLAMKTWHIRLVSTEGTPISPKQALVRFMLSWLWFMPAWVVAWLAGWHQSKLLYGAMAVWLLIYAGLTRLTPRQQFLHDALCGTRLIDTRAGTPR
jgi:uncharacterized RDD family membrane protein YckC